MSERKNAYEIIGGAAKVEELVDRFYDLMALEEPFVELRAMHSQDLSGSRDKLKLFLSGWLGGPDIYSPKYGHPMLRARHLPFKIGLKERNQWLACMYRAMEDCGIDGEIGAQLEESFFNTADWMRNQPNQGGYKLLKL
jgi:hemoglobin